MSKIVNGVPVIAAEEVLICHLCGKIAETRPCGPGGCDVCFECGMREPETTAHNMGIKLCGEPGKLI